MYCLSVNDAFTMFQWSKHLGEQQYLCERILIATGGWPYIPDFSGKKYVVSSNEMFSLDKLPERILIAGGGYIAVEFAGIMHGLGVETRLCYRGHKLLRGFDEDIRDFVAQEMRKKEGIDILFNTQIKVIEKTDSRFIATTDQGQHLEADVVLRSL